MLLSVLLSSIIHGDEGAEANLINRARQKDENACRQILNLYRGMIFSYAYRLVSNYHDAEELTFETFIRAFNALDSFSAERSFKTWLFTIAHNLIIDHLRKTRRERQYETIDDNLPGPDDFVKHFEIKRKLEKIETALNRLPVLDREIIILFHREQLSYQDIAATLKLPVTTVKTRLHRARKKLADLVKK